MHTYLYVHKERAFSPVHVCVVFFIAGRSRKIFIAFQREEKYKKTYNFTCVS